MTENLPFGRGAVPPTRWAAGLASPGSRFWACLLDSFLLAVPILVTLDLAGSIGVLASALINGGMTIAYGGALVAASGRTLGMRALRLRVVPLAVGAELSSGQAWVRAVAYTVPSLVPTVGLFLSALDCAWLLWDKPNRQTLHDKLARTVVVRDAGPRR